MSKKLESILSKVPSATARNVEGRSEDNIIENKAKILNKNDRYERIVAVIPSYLKREMRIYIADHPKENERTLILRGLRSIGFKISEEELEDKRGRS